MRFTTLSFVVMPTNHALIIGKLSVRKQILVLKTVNLPFTQDMVTEASLGLENQLNAHLHGIWLPGWLRGKESAHSAGDPRFDP